MSKLGNLVLSFSCWQKMFWVFKFEFFKNAARFSTAVFSFRVHSFTSSPVSNRIFTIIYPNIPPKGWKTSELFRCHSWDIFYSVVKRNSSQLSFVISSIKMNSML